jgi:hypothetical protein
VIRHSRKNTARSSQHRRALYMEGENRADQEPVGVKLCGRQGRWVMTDLLVRFRLPLEGRNGNYCPKPWQVSLSGGHEGSAIAEQFQQVVSGTDEFPLALDTSQTPKPEPTKAAHFFNLSEHGFDSCFA